MKIPVKYHLAEDTIDARDIDSLIEWLKTYPRLTKGNLTLEFERKWSQWLGRKYSVFCNSGSSANLLMYAALLENSRLRNGRVIVPSVGWVTTIAPIMQLKGFDNPLMCEADPDTFGLNIDHLKELLERYRPATVMMVQVLGVPHKMDEILDLQKRYDFILLEDACAAGGSSWRGRHVGTFGNMSSFSAYFGHQFSTIEGGLVSTDDKELYDTLLMLRSHGWGKDLDQETYDRLVTQHNINDFNKPFTFFKAGYNLRATDLQAFLGLGQLDKLEWLIQRRWKNHQLYKKLLNGYVEFQKYDNNSVICSIHFGALAEDERQRQKIVTALNANGVENRMFSAGNLGLHPFWYEHYGRFSAPIADRIHHCGFFLPNNPSLATVDIEFIANIVIDAVREG